MAIREPEAERAVDEDRRRARMRLGAWVFAWLVVIEVVEYVVGVTLDRTLPLLVVLAVPGAGLILWFYMHIGDITRGD